MKHQATLLLVDDDRHVLTSMADWLREQGYRTDTAVSLAEAKTAVGRKTYDLVLADIRLGDADGFDLLAHCRQNYPDTTVIMITGYGTVESAVEAIRLGAFDFLTKPLID
jgi:DNA-binding NtrC family response regulator